MSWNEYHFVSSCPVDAAADAVYAVLYEVVGYPSWWPEVREADQLDDDHITLRTRAVLPYDITFTLTRVVADPLAHVLQARLHGHAGIRVFLAGHRFATGAHAGGHTPSGGGARQG